MGRGLDGAMALNSGPRRCAQRWARAICEAFTSVDGLLYSSSMAGNAECPACFEGATDAMPAQPKVHRSWWDPLLRDFLRRATIRLGYGL